MFEFLKKSGVLHTLSFFKCEYVALGGKPLVIEKCVGVLPREHRNVSAATTLGFDDVSAYGAHGRHEGGGDGKPRGVGRSPERVRDGLWGRCRDL